MRVPVTLCDGRTGAACDVLVEAAAGDRIAALLPALLGCLSDPSAVVAHPAFAARTPVWVDGRPVDRESDLHAARLFPGSVVTLYEAPPPAGVPAGSLELRVVGGPGAGRVHLLSLGDTLVGHGAAGVSLPDLHLPPEALAVRVTSTGTATVTVAAGVVARLESESLDAGVETPWPDGAVLVAGDTVLALTPVSAPDADVSPSADRLGLDVNRPPRLLPPERGPRFTRPRPVRDLVKRPLPWLVVLAPMVMVLPMYFFFGWRVLFFALLSPVLALANWLSDRRGSRRAYLEDVRRFAEQDADVDRRIAEALRQEQRERRFRSPDPAELLLTALRPGVRLWERRHHDPDRLRLRLGTADAVADVEVGDPGLRDAQHAEPPAPRRVTDVPATVDLPAAGVVGIHGPHATRLARWLVAQAAVLHSPRDLRVVCLTGRDGEEGWGWLRWLPHAGTDDVAVGALVGTDQESTGRRLAELTALVADRLGSAGAGGRGWRAPPPDVLLVLDGARRLRALPAVVQLLRQGPAAGVYPVCLDEEEALLPEECRAVVHAADRVSIRVTGAESIAGIRPDLVDRTWPERVARALAPLRDTTPEADAGGIPPRARLLAVAGLEPPTAEAVLARWRRDGRTTEAVVGVGFDGPFHVDLRRDGPHALVAGTTGSGKSELLQTLVASLAIANRPDSLTFVLVDYKGGSAFKDCARLPHTVGMVTDLDEHLVQRALASLTAELRRREHLLAAPGAKDLEDYWALRAGDPALPAIPRLVLVIDEFASMVAELPDFVTGLVSLAQRGRSLGIHLVLATQRPSGVVSADIRANTNLRICLRVTDEAESRDVIDAPDAAAIGKDQPGRAFVRTGATSPLPFQAGRVGGRRAGPGPDGDDTADTEGRPPLVWPAPWSSLGLPAPRRPPPAAARDTDEGGTDLSALVEAIGEATAAAGVPRQPRPWLPALPDVLGVDGLTVAAGTGAAPQAAPAVAWALDDLPAQQAQVPRTFRPGRGGHLYVVGGPGSGRSTALRTLAVQLARAYPAADLHVHALDCGGGALLPLAELPNTGAVVPRTETERADRLLRRLVEEVARRQDLLASGGFADVDEQRAAVPVPGRLPYVVVLLDRWEGFQSGLGEVDGGRLGEDVQFLLREGASVGVQLVVSGDRSLLLGRMAALVEAKLLLRLPDPSDVSLAGLSHRRLPAHLPPGRGVWAGSATETQVAVLAVERGPDGAAVAAGGAGESAAVRDAGAACRERDEDLPAAARPFTLRPLPARVAAGDVLDAPMPAGPLWLPFGVGGDDAGPVGLDLSATPVAVVAGPARSGRTALLRWLLAAARARRAPGVACLAPRPEEPLAAEAGEAYVDPAVGVDGVVARMRALPPGSVVLVDDAEAFRDGEIAPAVQALVRQAREKRWGVVLAGLTAELGSGFTGWAAEARRGRQGVLLSPQQVVDGDAVGARLTRSMLAPRIQPGRGLLVSGGADLLPIQVPLVVAAGTAAATRGPALSGPPPPK
ncbi:MAG: FtsK/SpoIIIE domain-containing protein [Kineosporiaceae bacterium]